MSHSIYRHCDPRSGETRYVGRSLNPDQRYVAHLSLPGNTEMQEWHSELKALGLKPVLEVIETGILDIEEAKEREWYWIGYYLDLGANLTNYVLLAHLRRRFIKYLPPHVWEPLPCVAAEDTEEFRRRRSQLQIQCSYILQASGYKHAFCHRKGGDYYTEDLYILHNGTKTHRDLIMRIEEMDVINSLDFYKMLPDRVNEVFSGCNR